MKKNVLLLFIFSCLLFNLPLFATSNTLLLNTAKDYTNKKMYNKSIENLSQILANSPEYGIKMQALNLIAHNYADLGSLDNALKYFDEIIYLDKQKEYSLDAYWFKIIILANKLNECYINNNNIDNMIVNEITKTIYGLKEGDKGRKVITQKDGTLKTIYSVDMLGSYGLYILNSKDIVPIIKFRLVNMILPYLYQDEFINSKCYRPLRYDSKIPQNQIANKTKLPFFRVYFVLLRKVIETNDNEFINAGTTKENVLKILKTKTTVLTTDYDKDLFEALNYYYNEDTEQAYRLKKIIKENYKDKFKKAEISYNCGNYADNTKYSFTDYVFRDVESYVMTYCSMKKPKREKIDMGNVLKTILHDFFVPRNITQEAME